jgi:hypothetical protein
MKQLRHIAVSVLGLLLGCGFNGCLGQDTLDNELKEMLDNNHKVHIVFTQEFEGYHVEAVLHPDETSEEVGVAIFTFSGNGRIVNIETPYYWFWMYGLDDYPEEGNISYNGETYHVSGLRDIVQGQDSVIKEVQPFCFKDVDFDGKKEICFSIIGYNRTYYSVFKIMSDNKAVRMSEPPFESIVYGWGETSTSFDYESETIEFTEYIGCCEKVSGRYVRKRFVFNKLKPMKKVFHQSEYLTASGEIVKENR